MAAMGGVAALSACDGAPGDGAGQAEAEAPACITPITVAAVGDFLLHGPLQRFAAQQDKGMQAVMAPVEDLIQGADLALANLEGPAAENLVGLSGQEVPTPPSRYDGRAYGGYPMFNYHPSVVSDLKATGFDLLQTANNHSVDRGSKGVDKTLDALEAAKMPGTGTRRADAKREGHDWSGRFTVRRGKDAYQFAVVACTYGTNGLPDPKSQVLLCYDQREELLDQVRTLSADKDIAAVIVMPHWGNEYQPQPDGAQTTLAQELADAGAAAVIGSHPHVVQPDTVLTAKDGRGVPVAYSLGNFVSRQIGLPKLTSVIYLLGFTPAKGGKLAATLTGWIGLRMQTGAVFSIDPLDRLSEAEAAPYYAHLLRSFSADTRLPADPKVFWNRASKPVCAGE
jgi:poly-gamma-glutamate synthesis protein (capsule biosynthesis protein)